MFFRLLPWEYAIRNLFRRPLRTALTFAGLTTVILLVFVVVGFIRGLERSLAVSGDPQVGRDLFARHGREPGVLVDLDEHDRSGGRQRGRHSKSDTARSMCRRSCTWARR